MNVRRCALIVENEPFVALDLEDAMVEMGFYVCGLAATQDRACSLAASEQPDVVLMDACLEGGREGIEAARWLREACGAEVVFITGYTDRATLERIHEQVPGALCCRSRYLMLVLLKSSPPSFEAARPASAGSYLNVRHAPLGVVCDARYRFPLLQATRDPGERRRQ